METVLGILPGLHSNKCVGIDFVALGSRLPEGLFTPGAWETFVAINLRVLPTEASVPAPPLCHISTPNSALYGLATDILARSGRLHWWFLQTG